KVSQLNRQGVILEEIAALTYLAVLKLDQNAFTGTLPTFLGNMSAMVILSLAHNQFFGTIPKELGNLKELAMLAVSSNNFSGTLPPEIGNLPKLEFLYLDSCGAGGEIPPTFANLQDMRVMWVSDSPFSGKIPSFIGNWTKLLELRIQGNNFEGPIPASFSNLTSLTSLRISDLQNVSSSLDFIVNLTNLKDLIIRNALVSGPIPSDIIRLRNLTILDLSFNNLNGSLPQTLMNMTSLISLFLGNNSLSGSLLPDKSASLLNMVKLSPTRLPLQQEHESIFAIKCGGSQMRSANGILFETENSTALGPASYYLYQDKWAVSNGGIVIDRKDPSFIASTTISVDNTGYPELFRTSRKSPGSLRYYGLGLQNGPYTISLFFAETVFNRTRNTWQGHGRRVFDIYIQGNRRQRDFDISKEAGGIGRALVKDFSVTVTQNHLEIHLFWAGKGTCCIPEQGDYGPLISAIRVSPGFKVKSKSNKTGMIVGIIAGVASVSLLLLVFGLYMKRKSKHREEDEFLGMGPKVNTYTYSELKSATSDFSPSNLLGEGGFGPVYKGILNDGSVVAVKQLSVASHHGRSQFITEISTISAVQHWNLVKLHGSCIDGARRLLVYEYLENKSLDQALFGKTDVRLDWPTHFGLAKLYDDKRTHMSTRVAGTIGYLAPEYAMRGHLTSKADVFGFGVVCLEIISGRPNYVEKLDSEQKYLLQWAWSLYEIGRPLDLIDPSLTSFDEQQASRMIGVALMCVQASPSLRPAMSRVIAMLSGDVEISAVTTKPSYLTDWDFNDITNTFCDDEPTSSLNTTTTTTTTTTSFTTASTGTESMSSPIILSEVMNNGSLRERR
nr:probable LRR receptor-like serine/threonine-protein kinase At1g56140 isoform X2 [Tanacetum cinerariifolium]